MADQETYFGHSLKVNKDRCQGCTTCMRSCPTGAIRIRNGKAVVSDNKCVDCGECMKVCPHKAIYVQQDDFALIQNYKYRVCLVPTTFIGQFDEQYRTKQIYACLLKLGFTHIYEVEHEVGYMIELYKKYMAKHPDIRTFISPYCPAVIRLIQVRFPLLVDNVIKVRAPFELASRVVIKRLMDEGISPEDVGVFYITPCAAKIAAVKYPVSRKETAVAGVLNMDFLYNKVQRMLHGHDGEDAQPVAHTLTSRDVLWPLSGGEASQFEGSQFAVDGLRNILNFLERLENETVDAQGLVEMRICDQGCPGGVLTANNRFITRKRLEHRAKLFDEQHRTPQRYARYDDPEFLEWVDEEMVIPEIKPRSIYKLNDNFAEAIKMTEKMKRIEKALPGINCSACGAPSCAALAEDIVRGDTKIDTCLFMNRHSQTSEDAIRSIWGDRISTKKIEPENNNPS